MPRRKQAVIDDIYDILLITPWWFGPPLAAAAFALFRWGIPAIVAQGSFTTPIVISIATAFAPTAAGLVLLAWIVALFGKAQRRKLLDAQQNMESLRALSWQDFEKLVGEAFRRQGYTVVENGGLRSDGGIDLFITRAHTCALVQCKHWKTKKVGVEAVRAFYGVVAAQKATTGYFVTTGSFTRNATTFAKDRLHLVNGDQLWEMVQEIRSAQSVANDTATSIVAPLPGNADQQIDHPARVCPKCGGAMEIRTAKRGANAGNKFYGCKSYPQCRGTSPA